MIILINSRPEYSFHDLDNGLALDRVQFYDFVL